MKTKKTLKAITITLSCLLATGGLIGISRLTKSTTEEVKADINPNYGKPIYNSTAKTITYGLYPQTVVTDAALLDALDALDDSAKIASVDWYLYEGNYYKYISSASPHNAGYRYNNGDDINSDVRYWFKCEPITWKVLNTSGTKHICVSNIILDRCDYHSDSAKRTIGGKTIYPSNYKYSNMRAWLNGYNGSSYSVSNYTNNGFINFAFGLDSIDTSYILTTTVDNSISSTGYNPNPYSCDNTNDKVWLLSNKEVRSTYYKNNNQRKAKPSDYGLARGIIFEDSNGYYMLRSPANINSFGQNYQDVQGDGTVSYGFTYANYEGTRPVMRFNTINAADVIERINNIGTVEYTSECKTKIDSARNGYNALDDEQKVLVSNYSTLQAAETAYGNMNAAANVDSLINAIGSVSYPTSKTTINSARTAYNALNDDQIGLVTKLATLTDAETAYGNLRDLAVQNVIDLINEIGTVSYPEPDSGDDIDLARTAYNNLDSDDVSLVTNYQVLVDAENEYQRLVDEYAAEIDEVEVIINAIGEVIYTTDSKEKIDAARAAYDALTDDQKLLVDNYSTLTAAEAKYAEFEASGKDYLRDNDSGVEIKTMDGTSIPENIQLRVEVRTSVAASKVEEDLNKIKSHLDPNEEISKVYDVKLIKIVGGVETEIQPSDIKKGIVITVKMALPEEIKASKFRILHIHNVNDVEFVETFTLSDGEISFNVNRLSEFAFVTKVGLPGWAVALIVIFSVLLAICGAYILLFFVFNKWIKVGDKAVRVLRFALGSKDGKRRYLSFKYKFEYREKHEVFNTKDEALK